jgi:hypothetical protein
LAAKDFVSLSSLALLPLQQLHFAGSGWPEDMHDPPFSSMIQLEVLQLPQTFAQDCQHLIEQDNLDQLKRLPKLADLSAILNLRLPMRGLLTLPPTALQPAFAALRKLALQLRRPFVDYESGQVLYLPLFLILLLTSGLI